MGIQSNPLVASFKGFAKETAHSGFLIAPFVCSEENPILFINEDFRLTGKNAEEEMKTRLRDIALEEPQVSDYEQTREEYLTEISGLIRLLKEEKLSKVVYSRIININHLYTNKSELFQMLVDSYPNVFVYCFYLPRRVLWMGATPEVFLQVKPGYLQTMALAGTKKRDDSQWNKKEIQEQQYVSRFIHEVLDICGLEERTENRLESIVAGACEHLHTIISARADLPGEKLAYLIRLLHPTPAVCGYPQKEAMAEILKREPHDRQFYSGFLGPVSAVNRMELFVNLRCMKMSKNRISLFAGGGITKDSNLQEEWEETELKANTLGRILERNANGYCRSNPKD